MVDIKDETVPGGNREISCLRCHILMNFAGEFKFHEGAASGVWGNLFELFVNKESFDLYVCPQCGKVEFFLPALRSKN